MTRRTFLSRSGLTILTFAGSPRISAGDRPGDLARCSICVFSKVYKEPGLSFEEAAEVTAKASLDGIDCPVRAGEQVLPERVSEDLPRLAEVLKRRGLKVLLLTTAIQNPGSPHAEAILRTASRLRIKFYRLGYWKYETGKSTSSQLAEIKSQLKELAALNKELGMCALLQNHSGDNLVGANVRDNYELSREFDPEQIALAFDIGHAIKQLGHGWQEEFQSLQKHLGVVYVKDFKPGVGFVPLGQGEIAQSGFIELLKRTSYHAPISLHVEYDWSDHERSRTKEKLLQQLRGDREVLKKWLRS